jgi:hypothetical protein
MKKRGDPDQPLMRIIDLEMGRPTVFQALGQLDYELKVARREGSEIVKLIHGYGSSGAGGDIRIAVQRRLLEMARDGQIRMCIFGEDWSKSNETTWSLLQTRPNLKQDKHLGRKNLGITIVVL